MRVLVTGGRGMLGQHIVRDLIRLGHEVLAPTSSELDLRELAATDKFMAQQELDAVIHCAAVVGGIQANIEGGGKFLTENLEIDHSVIFSAHRNNIKNFIYIGSSCMYPANVLRPLVIEDLLTGPLEPTNENYALAKITGTKAVEAFDGFQQRNWKTFVASNLYGPGDHFEPGRSHLLAAIIAKVHQAKLSKTREIVMWGDGKVRREFTYIQDFSEWVSGSLDNLQKFPPVLNVGCGIDYTVKEFYEKCMSILGFDGELRADLTKPNGNLRKLMDSSTARELGWNPSTSIEDGISKTNEWLEQQLK
jgi:GDP-L-fucose synthase